MKPLLTAAAVLAIAAPACADGDIAMGAREFKKCRPCHAIVSPEGEVIVKGGRSGPNLWGIVGQPAAADEKFTKYSDGLIALGEDGLVWDAENLASFIPNAKAYIGGKTAMTPQGVKDMNGLIAFMAQYGPQ